MRVRTLYVTTQLGAVLLLAGALSGCPKPGTDMNVPGTDMGTPGTDMGVVDPMLYGPIDLNVSCPGALTDIGTPGGFGIDTTSVVWHYDDVNEVSWAPPIYFNVPADTVSLAITVEHEDYDGGLALLEVGGTTWVDFTASDDTGWGGSPFYHYPAPAGTIVLPMDDTSFPAQGCLAIFPIIDLFDVAGGTGTIYVSSKRAAGTVLDLNMIIVNGAGINTTDVDAAVAVMDALYQAGGVGSIGTVNYVATGGNPLIASEGADINALRATDPGSGNGFMNIFFITDFIDDPGTLGIAAGIPGPLGIHGTVSSGMVVSVDAHLDVGFMVDTTLLGETIAHELGHQLGLFHTSEGDGFEYDFLSDTPNCPLSEDADGDGYLDADECAAYDGMNLMFWIASDNFSQNQLSPIQALVLNSSPVIR